MSKIFLPALLSLSILATPAIAQAAKSDSNDASDTGGKKHEKMICRTDQVTGSILARKKTCHTAAEWNELAAQQQEQLSRSRSRPGIDRR